MEKTYTEEVLEKLSPIGKLPGLEEGKELLLEQFLKQLEMN